MEVAYLRARKDALTTMAEPVPMVIRNAPTRLMKDLGYGDGYQYGYHYFTVTPKAEHTYALLNDAGNYISGEQAETVIVTKD